MRDEEAQALVHLRRRQPDAGVLVHRLDHVVDELLQQRIAELVLLDRPRRAVGAPDAPSARLSESTWTKIILESARVHSARLTPPFRFCPVCGGALESRVLKAANPKRLVCTSRVRLRLLSRSQDRGRHGHPRRPTDASCSSGAPSSPATASGCFRAATSIAARRSRSRRSARRARKSGLDVRIDRLINIYSYAGRTPVDRRVRGDDDRRVPGGAMTKGSKRRFFEPEAIPVGRARVPQHARGAAGVSRSAGLRDRDRPSAR